MNERYSDEELAVIAAMKDLMQLKMPPGLHFEKNEALVQTVKLTKTRLRAVGQEDQLFVNCFTVDKLVKKT